MEFLENPVFWDWYWTIGTLFVVLFVFLPAELYAATNDRPGDTYSEWWWRNILWPKPGHWFYRYRRLGRIALVCLLVVLAIHGLTEGKVI